MGILFTIIGVIACILLFNDNGLLALIAFIATLYQASSLNEMNKENLGIQREDSFQTLLNLLSTIVIVILFLIAIF